MNSNLRLMKELIWFLQLYTTKDIKMESLIKVILYGLVYDADRGTLLGLNERCDFQDRIMATETIYL